MATIHACLLWTYHARYLLSFAFLGSGARNTCWHFLASPPRVGMGSTLSSGTRNAGELAFPSTTARTWRIQMTTPRNANSIGHYIYKCYSQAHESIVVAFHLKVFRLSLFIFFPKEGNGNKYYVMSMSKADMCAYYPNDHTGIKTVVV
jgi:hypothetical protein